MCISPSVRRFFHFLLFLLIRLHTLGIALFDIVRMVTMVRTDVTPSVTRAGDWERGKRKVSQDNVTMSALGPKRWITWKLYKRCNVNNAFTPDQLPAKQNQHLVVSGWVVKEELLDCKSVVFTEKKTTTTVVRLQARLLTVIYSVSQCFERKLSNNGTMLH